MSTRRTRRLAGPIGIVAKRGARDARPHLERLTAWLEARGLRHLLDREAARILRRRGGQDIERLAPRSSLMVVLGGDGTLLSVARATAGSRTPILGVNLGGLGFLAEVSQEGLFGELDRVLAGEFQLDERLMLDLRVLHDGRMTHVGSALNDVVITKKSAIARAVDLNVEVDGRYVTSYKADGLIVSTPTGSTAYSLSAGGPILDPRIEALILNPICPHTLTHRPLVLPATVTIEVSLMKIEDGVFLTIDGQVGHPLRTGDRVRISRAAEGIRLVQTAERDYFHLLRSKLKWGERLTR